MVTDTHAASPIGLPGPDVRGGFVSVEGIDASGKSTVARLLAERIAETGRPTLLLDRNTATASLDGYPADHLTALRSLIWDYPPDAVTSALGFGHWSHLIGAWFHAVDHTVVRPALGKGLCVITDSWLAKFAARFALSVGPVDAMATFDGVTRPDVVVWLDVPPEQCVARRTDLRSTERGEWQGLGSGDRAFIEYQGLVREVYRGFAAAESWLRVGPAEPAEVADRVLTRITAEMAAASTPAEPTSEAAL